MSYVLDPNDGMYYWDEDGVGNINNIPVEAVGKIKSNPAVNAAKAREDILKGLRQGGGSVVPSSQDFDVYWNTGESEYQGSQFVSGETARSFTSIEQEFKNYSIKDPEYLKWVDALKKTEFGSSFPKKKTPTKGQVLSALRKAGQEASITGTSLQDLVYNNAEYAIASGTGISAQAVSNSIETIKARALNIGVELSDSQAKKLATQYAQGGMSAEVLDANIAKFGKIDINKGEAATQKATLKQWAGDNGVSFDESWYDVAVNNILTGKGTFDTYKANITSQAKGLYSAPYFTEGLDGGFSIRQQASPYITYLAKIRGVDPTSISLSDPVLMKNLTKRDDKGNPVIPSYYDFTLDVRKNDPTWGYSYEAQDETTSMLNTFGKMFGKSW
jgi:hypothetical protein